MRVFPRVRARARMCARAVEYINMFKTLRTTISQIYSSFGQPDQKLFSRLCKIFLSLAFPYGGLHLNFSP